MTAGIPMATNRPREIITRQMATVRAGKGESKCVCAAVGSRSCKIGHSECCFCFGTPQNSIAWHVWNFWRPVLAHKVLLAISPHGAWIQTSRRECRWPDVGQNVPSECSTIACDLRTESGNREPGDGPPRPVSSRGLPALLPAPTIARGT